MKATTADTRSLDLLRQACERRASAEIELATLDGDKHTGRVRLIRCDDQAVYIDHPTRGNMPLELNSDMYATVYFFRDGERYAFRSWIGEECWVPVGDGQQHLTGYALPMPDHVSRAERRHDFRASLGQNIEVVCEVQPLGDNGRRTFQARVMDLSAGGLGIIAIDVDPNDLRTGAFYNVRFALPNIKKSFQFRTRLCHMRSLGGNGCIVGLQYPSDTTAVESHAIRQVSQFVARQAKHKRARPVGP